MRGRSKKQRQAGRRAERRPRAEVVPMPPVDFEPTFTHYKLLFCADSSNLNELRSGLKTHGFPQDYDWPATPLREAKRALRELIEAGLIEVYAEVGVPL